MPDFSLVPVDHQPDFSEVSLVPVDHDPFGADDATQEAQVQQAQMRTEPEQSQQQGSPQWQATGADQPGIGPSGAGGNAPGQAPHQDGSLCDGSQQSSKPT